MGSLSNSRMFRVGQRRDWPTPAHTCTHSPSRPSQFSAKVSHLLSHSHRVSLVYLAPCGRKCLVSLMASSKDPAYMQPPLCVQSDSTESQSGPIRTGVPQRFISMEIKPPHRLLWRGLEFSESSLLLHLHAAMLESRFQRHPDGSLTRCFLTFWASPRKNPQ